MMWSYTNASLLDNFSCNFLCFVDFSYFLNAWFGCEVFKQGVVKNAPFDDSSLDGYTSQILHIQLLLVWKKYDDWHRLHGLKNLLIDCLLFMKEKLLEYTRLQMLMTLLFPLVYLNIHKHYLFMSSFSPKLSSPTLSLSNLSWHIISPCWPSVRFWTSFSCWLLSTPGLKWNIEDRSKKDPTPNFS